MQAKLTKSQFVKWLNNSVGHKYDMDNYAGFQCVDYANAGWQQLFSHNLAGEGAADIPTANNFSGKAKIYHNTPSFLAQPGDLVIFPRSFGNGYGHVAWVVSATLNKLVLIEQNWLGGGWTEGPIYGGTGWETATKRIHPYDPNMIFIRPNFKTAAKKPSGKQITWNWKGRFTAKSTIKVRRSPGLKGSAVDSGSWIYKNQWVDFVSVTKKDGYWWAKFKYPTNPKAGYFYMAIAKITDKKERLKKEKALYGVIKYK